MKKLITKIVLLTVCSLATFNSLAQQTDSLLLAHFKSISPPTTADLPQLVKYLTAPYPTKKDQFRSIYLWLIHHIDYDIDAVDNKRINQSNQDILDRRKAICWGYATLLKTMCEEVDIPIIVITGYVRTGLTDAPFLDYPNHAWNAVQLEDRWQLVDATWDSQHLSIPSLFFQKFESTYYLTKPSYFISNHLPADPQWQLLPCPISIQDFQLSTDSIVQLASNNNCNQALSSPTSYASLHYFDQQLQKGINSYQFNPTEDNRRELAHIQIEYQEYLSEQAERLQLAQKIDSLLAVQLQMIKLCEIASSLTKLYDTQQENCAYNYFNHAVALSQLELTAENEQYNVKQMLHYFQLAANQLKTLPQNIFTEQALALSTDYLAYLKSRLESIKK